MVQCVGGRDVAIQYVGGSCVMLPRKGVMVPVASGRIRWMYILKSHGLHY